MHLEGYNHRQVARDECALRYSYRHVLEACGGAKGVTVCDDRTVILPVPAIYLQVATPLQQLSPVADRVGNPVTQ